MLPSGSVTQKKLVHQVSLPAFNRYWNWHIKYRPLNQDFTAKLVGKDSI